VYSAISSFMLPGTLYPVGSQIASQWSRTSHHVASRPTQPGVSARKIWAMRPPPTEKACPVAR
jgi:hypothetical protein